MDNEILNKLIGQMSANERVTTLLLADALRRLPEYDRQVLEGVLLMKTNPPATDDIGAADDWAGRGLEYERVAARILAAAQEIAFPRDAQN